MYKILDSWKSNSRFQSILLKCSDNEMFNYNTYTYLHNVHKTKKDRHAEKGEHQDEPALWKMNKGKNCIRPVQLTLKYMNSVSHSKFRWTDYVIWIVLHYEELRSKPRTNFWTYLFSNFITIVNTIKTYIEIVGTIALAIVSWLSLWRVGKDYYWTIEITHPYNNIWHFQVINKFLDLPSYMWTTPNMVYGW